VSADHLAAKRRQLTEQFERSRQRQREKDDRAHAAREAIARELGYPSFSYMLSIGLVRAVASARQPRRQAAE